MADPMDDYITKVDQATSDLEIYNLFGEDEDYYNFRMSELIHILNSVNDGKIGKDFTSYRRQCQRFQDGLKPAISNNEVFFEQFNAHIKQIQLSHDRAQTKCRQRRKEKEAREQREKERQARQLAQEEQEQEEEREREQRRQYAQFYREREQLSQERKELERDNEKRQGRTRVRIVRNGEATTMTIPSSSAVKIGRMGNVSFN